MLFISDQEMATNLVKEVFEAELNHEDALNETDNIFVSNFAEKLQEINSDSSNQLPTRLSAHSALSNQLNLSGSLPI